VYLPLHILDPIVNFQVDPSSMKQLLSFACFMLYMHNIGQPPLEVKITSSNASGEKVLIKALTAIVSREGNKKIPTRKIDLSSSEGPWL
jgi:hypothetical protein